MLLYHSKGALSSESSSPSSVCDMARAVLYSQGPSFTSWEV